MESVKITNRGEDIVSVLKRTDTIILISEMYFFAYDWRSYLQEFDFSPEVFQIIAEAVFLNEDWGKGRSGRDYFPAVGRAFSGKCSGI